MITWLLLKKWTMKEYIPPREDMSDGIEEAKSDDINELFVHEEGLPNAFISLLPILIPVGLMAAGSFIMTKTPQIDLLKEALGDSMASGKFMAIFVPYLIGVIMMTAVGSMTTADSGQPASSSI
ncbi:MAG: hypothetical protein PUC44_02010 [Eubacteriales bacterium]|nr:hypothetical protein [Eubacteriales bacterium]